MTQRRTNLLALFAEFVAERQANDPTGSVVGLDKAFALHLEVNNTYLSGMKSGARSIGDRLARQIEVKCNKPKGWLDAEHQDESSAQPRGLSTFLARAEAAYRAADADGRKQLLAAVNRE